MAMVYQDKMLTCRDCGARFTFTAGEQEFYASKGLSNEPARCPTCRAARRAQRDGLAADGTRPMHEVTCAMCGGVARVPFIPREDRPVYCSTCYETVRMRRYSSSDRF